MGYSAKEYLASAMSHLVSPVSHFFHNFDGCRDVPNIFPKQHYLSSLASGVKIAREDSDPAFQYHIKRVFSCTSKEDGRKFVLLYTRANYQSRSTSILAVNCNPMSGTKTPHFRSTIVKAHTISVPFCGRVLLSFNRGKHTPRKFQLVRYERYGEISRHSRRPLSLATFSALLTIVNTEPTANYNPTTQLCRCFVGATWEALDRFWFRPDESTPLWAMMSSGPSKQECGDDEKYAQGREEARVEVDKLEAQMVQLNVEGELVKPVGYQLSAGQSGQGSGHIGDGESQCRERQLKHCTTT